MTSGHRVIAFAALFGGLVWLCPGVALGAPKKHVVAAGDSLWKIAHQSGITVAALRKENGMKEGDVLKTGDRKSTRLNSSHLKLSRMPSSA